MFWVYMKNGNIYLTLALEIINNNLDMRFMDIEGDYVIVDTKEVERITLEIIKQ
jgi:hypothetical protein